MIKANFEWNPLRCNTKPALVCLLLVFPIFSSGCHRGSPSGFLVVSADHHVVGNSKFPIAVDLSKVGTYPVDTDSGAGYFYDDVLEYRVWVHPDKGGAPINGDKDYYFALAQYESAETFSKNRAGAEPPLVLVRQREWIDEPKHGQFIPRKEERITEWQVKWLDGGKRNDESIEQFLKHPYEADSDENN